MNYQRAAVGISGLVFVMLGLVLLWANQGQDTSVSGILVRVGVMLCVFWLGYPVLIKPEGKQSLVWFLVLFGTVFLVAFRPRLFPGIAALATLGFLINWGIKRLNRGR